MLIGGKRFYSSAYLGEGRLAIREESLRVPDLAEGLDGFTLAHLSDLHAGPFVGAGSLASVVSVINQRKVDACVLTGDFVTHHWSEAPKITAELAQLESRFGSFAVFGNHDYKDRSEGHIEAEYSAVGVRFLRNSCARIEVEVEGAAVALVGIEDLEEGREIDLEAARREVEENDVEIVLCHNPLGAGAIARPGCKAILSGHTHGTQVDLPWLRTFGPPHPGVRVELGQTSLIVNRGVGVVGIPFRFGSPAEIVFVTLERGDAR